MRLLLGAFFAAMAAWMLGKSLGIPAWTAWSMGDRTDIALLVFAAVLLVGSSR